MRACRYKKCLNAETENLFLLTSRQTASETILIVIIIIAIIIEANQKILRFVMRHTEIVANLEKFKVS